MPIAQDEAIRRAVAFLRTRGVEVVESFDGIAYNAGRSVMRPDGCRLAHSSWSVVFRRLTPPDIVDTPGCAIVDVDAESGEAGFFSAI